jgi:hypothetical protein
MREMVEEWASISARGGGVKWHFSDASTHGRVQQEVCRCSGVLDGMHVPKDIYFAFKAIWRDDPQVHIMGHWNYTTHHIADVYSNCDEVEFFVNGVSRGILKPLHGRCTWSMLPFAPGILRAEGRRAGAVRCIDERKTAGKPDSIALSVVVNPAGIQADGVDVALVDARIVDSLGNRCPTADNLIVFDVTGPGRYCGGYNSYIQNTPGKKTLAAEAGLIRVGIRSTDVQGTIAIQATSPGLKSGVITCTTTAPGQTHTGIGAVPFIRTRSQTTDIGTLVCRQNGGRVHIGYAVSHAAPVRCDLMTMKGSTVRSWMVINEIAGSNEFIIDISGDHPLASGWYGIRVSVAGKPIVFSKLVVLPR